MRRVAHMNGVLALRVGVRAPERAGEGNTSPRAGDRALIASARYAADDGWALESFESL